jgi:phosphoglucomutase
MNDFRVNPPSEMNGVAVDRIVDVKESTITHLKTGKKEPLDMDKSNVMQFYLVDGSKISARPSGTEPKIKYYFSVNSPLADVKDYRKKETELEEKLEGLKKYFS